MIDTSSNRDIRRGGRKGSRLGSGSTLQSRLGQWVPGGCCFGVLSVAAAVLFFGGCDSGQPAKPSAPRRLVQQPPQVDQNAGPARPAAAPGMSPPGVPGPLGQPGAPQPQEQPSEEKAPRPDDITKWKKSDYLSAKKENDPRLLQAVEYLGANFVGKPNVARGLADILRAEEPEEKGDDSKQPGAQPGGRPGPGPGMRSGPGFELGMDGEFGPGGYGPGGYGTPHRARLSRQLIEAIVMALGNNNTDEARKTLRELVAGSFKTDDTRTAATAALQQLVYRAHPKNEEFLLVALTTPEKIRKPGQSSTRQPARVPGRPGFIPGGMGMDQAELTAEQLRRDVLQLIEPMATEQFRVKLAKYMLSPSASTATVRELRGMIETQRPDNVAAQILIYQSKVPNEQIKARLEQHFTRHSSTALGLALGLLAERTPLPGAIPNSSPWGEPAGQPGPGGRPAGGGWDTPPVGGGWGRSPGRSVRPPSGRVPFDDEMLGRGGGYGPRRGPRGMPVGPMGRRPPGGSPYTNRPSPVAADPDLPYKLAQRLWAADFTNTVRKRLGQMESLKSTTQVFQLARTMPVDSVRAELFKLLQDHWKDGPGQLGLGNVGPGFGGPGFGGHGYGGPVYGGPGLGGPGEIERLGGFRPGSTPGQSQTINDPGFLILVKMLPRKEAAGSQHGNRPPGRQPRGPRLGMDEGGYTPPGGTAAPPQEWMKASETLLRTLCAQFHNVAKSPAGNSETATSPATLPVQPHNSENVVASFDLVLPGGAPKKFSGQKLDPMAIHYLRIEETANPIKVLSYYRRKVKCKGRPIDHDTGVWLDSLERDSTTGRRRSIDVLITKTQAAPGGMVHPGAAPGRADSFRKRNEPIVVEIFSIEINDPAPTTEKG